MSISYQSIFSHENEGNAADFLWFVKELRLIWLDICFKRKTSLCLNLCILTACFHFVLHADILDGWHLFRETFDFHYNTDSVHFLAIVCWNVFLSYPLFIKLPVLHRLLNLQQILSTTSYKHTCVVAGSVIFVYRESNDGCDSRRNGRHDSPSVFQGAYFLQLVNRHISGLEPQHTTQ